jgi:hypothetical protein
MGYGLQWGLRGDCICGEDLGCWADPFTNQHFSDYITANLKPCKTYYLWINGFAGDFCDFTINTSSQDIPELQPLGFINNDSDGIIGSICEGACDIPFFIPPQSGGCLPTYIWTFDGVVVGDNSGEIKLDFPNEGDFKLCVTAIIGNPVSGSICSEQGPRCATVKVRKSNLVFFDKRILCFEQTQPNGYDWYGHTIFNSGVYKQHLVNKECCELDSIIEFTVLDKQGPPVDVYFVSCENEPYIDPLGREHFPCKDKIEISLPGSTTPNACDSSINLSAVHANIVPNWKFRIKDGKIELNPDFVVSNPCNLGESYEFEYRWYKANDPNQSTISTEESLKVDYVTEEYCVQVNIKVIFNTSIKYCSKTFCESFNENSLLMSDVCEHVNMFCSLDELNGFEGSNWSQMPSLCNPLCSQGGVGHNTNWIGFVSKGGLTNFIFTIGECDPLSNQGMQVGIWGDCSCWEEVACASIPCIPPNSQASFKIVLYPNKIYYLFLDGCSGDICDFTINTSGGGSPVLSPLGFINDIPTGIIEPVCKGSCYHFYVNKQPVIGEPNYVWTVDGTEYYSDNQFIHKFDQVGDFEICVTAYIGNVKNYSICSKEGPRCATVKVRDHIDTLLGKKRFICWEDVNPDGYSWHSQKIYQSGVYREHLNNINCCEVDSVVEFSVQDIPTIPQVYYLTCNNEPFIDLFGDPHFPCKDSFEISLPSSTQSHHCDSAIILTAVNVDFLPDWQVNCAGGQIELAPNIKITDPCNAGEVYQFEYRWYKQNDSSKIVISTEEYLKVPLINEVYCVEVDVIVQLQTAQVICTKTFCESIDESVFNNLAGRDFKQKGILARLNAAPIKKGSWRLISGPGIVSFQNVKDPKSRVKVNEYGNHCFEWTSTESGCDWRDTVCVQFYQIKIATPDSPNKIYEDRDDFSYDNENIDTWFTPSLITRSGMSFILIDDEVNALLNYHWVDIYGKSVINENIMMGQEVQKLNIKSPLQEGFYFLVIEINGQPTVRKVCVID